MDCSVNYILVWPSASYPRQSTHICDDGSSYASRGQGILKREVLLYHWPPVWLVWNQLYDNWKLFIYLQNKLIQTSQTGGQGILKREVLLYHWPPVWLVWYQLYDNWIFFSFYLQNRLIQTNHTGGQWYSDTSPLVFPAEAHAHFWRPLVCAINILR